MTQLRRFNSQALRTPFVYGTFDCCLYPADWVRLCSGVDPAANFRGRYSTASGAALLTHRHGGLQTLFGRIANAAGLVATERPDAGDVGVISVMTEDGARPAGAIFDGRRWTFLTLRGLAAATVAPLSAWSAPCLRP